MPAMSIPVWDPLVRVFHWLLVSCFGVCYFTAEIEYETHRIAGYMILVLILVRVVWGFIGTRHARFGDFVIGPRRLGLYLAALACGRAPRYLGHNPAGAIMVLALLTILLTAGLSGVLLDAAENRAGPLGDYPLFLYSDPIRLLHTRATDLGLVLIFLHMAGVVHASILHRENLIKAMLTGRKSPQPPVDD
jgi:cytochrome b